MRPPHTRPATWPGGIPPGRFAARIGDDLGAGGAVAILGMPDDTGVKLNGGRPGAGSGPSAFRAALSRYGTALPAGRRWPAVVDAGDIEPGPTLEETHSRVTEAAGALHDAGFFPVGIGGGHDLTFPFVRAAAEQFGALAGIYFDAHLDVRAEPGSGMPFRALIESGHARELHVMGLDRFANSAKHRSYFNANGGHVDSFGPTDPDDAWPRGDLFASFDLDVIDQAHAPGVSASNPCGWSPREASAWCDAVGRRPGLRCFDIMELCPEHDESGRTARLAARLFLSFLAGFAERNR